MFFYCNSAGYVLLENYIWPYSSYFGGVVFQFKSIYFHPNRQRDGTWGTCLYIKLIFTKLM